jgi:predicted dehydrogenase
VDFGTGYNKGQAFCAQMQNFVRAVRREEVMRTKLEDAMAAMKAIDAGYRSAQTERWVALARMPAG